MTASMGTPVPANRGYVRNLSPFAQTVTHPRAVLGYYVVGFGIIAPLTLIYEPASIFVPGLVAVVFWLAAAWAALAAMTQRPTIVAIGGAFIPATCAFRTLALTYVAIADVGPSRVVGALTWALLGLVTYSLWVHSINPWATVRSTTVEAE